MFAATPAAASLSGTIQVPGDKSISHRALLLGGLACGESQIDGLLEGEDVFRTAAAMRSLGAEIFSSNGRWIVRGREVGALKEPEDVIDLGNSGTSSRLLAGVLATHKMTVCMTGDASLRQRPMRRVIEPLSLAGARFMSRTSGRLPMAIDGTGEAIPIHYEVPVPSAQIKSAILLAGLNARGETVVEERLATRDHTERMLLQFGIVIDCIPQSAGRIIRLTGGQKLRASTIVVPGDVSSAAFPVVAALCVPGSSVTIRRVGINPLRTGLLETLQEMGASIEIDPVSFKDGEPMADLTVRYSKLRAVDVPPDRIPSMVDEIPILAVAAACARGATRLRGLGELRVKESDRLAATANMLKQNGVEVCVEADDLIITGIGGRPPGGGFVVTNMDHRLAMSGAILGLIARETVHIDDMSFVATSFPGFLDTMNSLRSC